MALNQLRLLLWITQKRRPQQTACMIFIPLICVGLLALAPSQLSASQRFQEHEESNFDPFTIDTLDSQLLTKVAGRDHDVFWTSNEKGQLHVYFSPNNTLTRRILQRVGEKLDVETKGNLFPVMCEKCILFLLYFNFYLLNRNFNGTLNSSSSGSSCLAL